MAQRIAFAKMHGLGNDFVIMNQKDLPANCKPELLAIRVADRRTGIGCDQFIIYNKLITPEYGHYEMFVYNQDGSLAKACGNATRCLAKLMHKNFGETQITIKVAGREINCEVKSDFEVSVNMGRVSFNESWMPPPQKLWPIAERYMIEPKEIICADIGNPHIVIFSNLSFADKEIIGAKFQEDELFPDGVNVNFAKIEEDKIHLLVWERGAGFTLACGSGACVSYASAFRLGFISGSAEVVFKLGSLKMTMKNDDIIMQGHAALVATGEFYAT